MALALPVPRADARHAPLLAEPPAAPRPDDGAPTLSDILGLIIETLERRGGSSAVSMRQAALAAARAPSTETALKLAAASMEDAQRTIARQQARIAYLESLSVTDELTGLLNRRGFNLEVRRVLAEGARHRQAGVLIVVDLDRFKTVNDRWGHAAGDALLALAARSLASQVRESDSVARLGGDEFAVLLPATDAADGRRRARSLDALLNSQALDWQGTTIRLGASVGVEIIRPGDREDDLFARADRRMYARKRRKR